MRVLITVYGVASYLTFFGAFLYMVGFLGNWVVPKHINDGAEVSVVVALIVNLALVSIFALQHSIMARPWFKALWTRVVPDSAERSTYVLFSSLIFVLMFWQWRPMPNLIWHVEGPGAHAIVVLHFVGWAVLLSSSFMIDHFQLFGLRQVYDNQRKQQGVPTNFVVRGFYKLVRHPLMLGFLIAFWSTPHMTQGHLLFALANTAYILVALRFEERDLVDAIGDDYLKYQEQVPMLVPIPKIGAPD